MGLIFTLGFIVIAIGILLSTVRIVRQSEVYLVERLGKYSRTLESGVAFVIPFIERISAKKDLREQVVDFPPQPTITKDNVSIQVDFVVYYQITDAVRHQYEISNPLSAINNLTATSLRNLVGEQDLDQMLTSRETVNTRLRIILDEATDKWGLKINRVEVKNIITPTDIQQSMEKQMVAERSRREQVLNATGTKEAAILRAEGERQSRVLQAQGEKEAAILKAQGEAEAILQIAEAQAKAELLVLDAWKSASPTPEMVHFRALEAMEKMAMGPANKLVIPTDATKMLGMVEAVKEVWKDSKTD